VSGGAPSSDGLPFETLAIADAPVVTAPDGSTVHVLPRVAGGSMAHFTLEPDQASSAVVHRTVEELWFVVGGSGEMWRRAGDRSSVVALGPGTALTIPLGTAFAFRAGPAGLRIVALTVPPWPGPDEALPVADGPGW
jgi:mannose-6-phosphate isomerase-like protein (cupin superfamily)